MIKKILIFAFLAFLAYKASTYYFFYTSAKKTTDCPTAKIVIQLEKSAKYTREELLASTKAWRCLKLKQNFAEAYFFKIPDSWLNPSIEYVNPPFTEAELNPEVTLVDGAIKRDLYEFSKIFSKEVLKEITAESPDVNIAKVEEVESHFQRKMDALKVVVAKLREFRPDSIKITTLKTQLAYSLSQFQQNISEGMKIYAYSNQKIAEGEVLLSMPKEQLKLHREELLSLKFEMDTLSAKIEQAQTREVQLAKELVKIADEIDELISIYL